MFFYMEWLLFAMINILLQRDLKKYEIVNQSFSLSLTNVNCSLPPHEGEYYAVSSRQLYNPQG